MSEILSNNSAENSLSSQSKLSLTERLDQDFLAQNEWKNLNGGCPISPDIKATLQLLKQNVHPLKENLEELVNLSVAKYALPGQTIEQIWADKIAEGANFVGVVDGVFSFYRGEEKLIAPNKPLQVPALPAALKFREQNKTAIYRHSIVARNNLRAGLRSGNSGDSGVSSAQI